MSSYEVRRIGGKDVKSVIPGIINVFRDDEVVPWHKYDTCLAWVSQRVQRGFYSTLAYDGGKIVGISEWIETYDAGRKISYLGMMQVDCDLRGRGIGGAMLADGERYAKSIGASCMRTLPEDKLSYEFYRKYAFKTTDTIYYCICPTIQDVAVTPCIYSVTITLDAANTHEFIFGLCQSSGRHMYEVANHHPVSNFLVKTSCASSGYLQFRYEKETKTATALYWNDETAISATVAEILAHGYAQGFEEVEFYFKSKYVSLFAQYNVCHENTELEKEIGPLNE